MPTVFDDYLAHGWLFLSRPTVNPTYLYDRATFDSAESSEKNLPIGPMGAGGYL